MAYGRSLVHNTHLLVKMPGAPVGPPAGRCSTSTKRISLAAPRGFEGGNGCPDQGPWRSRRSTRYPAGPAGLDSQLTVITASRLVFRWTAADIAGIDWGGFDATIGANTLRIRHTNGSVELLAFKRLPTAGIGEAMTFDRARAERFIATVKMVKDPESR